MSPRYTGGPRPHGVPVRRFAKGENKEEIARPLIEAAERDGGDGRVVLIGIAQEKTPMWRSWKAKGQEHVAHPHMEWGRQMGFVNHFYFYLWLRHEVARCEWLRVGGRLMPET